MAPLKCLRVDEKLFELYHKKFRKSEIFVPVYWVTEGFGEKELEEIIKKSLETGIPFEKYMPKKYLKKLEEYRRKIEAGFCL